MSKLTIIIVAMKTIFYISDLKPGSKIGGSVAGERNLRFLKNHFNVIESGVYALGRPMLKKIIDVFTSNVPTLYSRKQVNKIKSQLKETDAEIVFIESSRMGYLAKYAKKLNKKVYVFFHNCEYKLFKDTRGKVMLPFIKKQEKLTLKYSDHVYYLNKRDLDEINEIYKIKMPSYSLVPLSFKDTLTKEDIKALENKKNNKTGLFLGSFFVPNYRGVKWFVENVAPYVDKDIKFKIVGKGFEEHQELARDNVSVIGFVDDLKETMMDADFFISPIFDGSGMKVKTVEQLMYGKTIFGTKESFEGYKYIDGAYVKCKDDKDFINKINDFAKNGKVFNPIARKLFSENYDDNIVENDFIKPLLSI